MPRVVAPEKRKTDRITVAVTGTELCDITLVATARHTRAGPLFRTTGLRAIVREAARLRAMLGSLPD